MLAVFPFPVRTAAHGGRRDITHVGAHPPRTPPEATVPFRALTPVSCPTRRRSFAAGAFEERAHLTTDDGSLTGSSGATLDFGPDGHVTDPSFIVNAGSDAAHVAETGTGVISGLEVELTIASRNGQLQGTTVGAWFGGDGLTPVARIEFDP